MRWTMAVMTVTLGFALACGGGGSDLVVNDDGCPVAATVSKGDSGTCKGEYLGTDGKTLLLEGGEFKCGDCDGMLNHPDAAGRILEVQWKVKKGKAVVAEKVTVIE